MVKRFSLYKSIFASYRDFSNEKYCSIPYLWTACRLIWYDEKILNIFIFDILFSIDFEERFIVLEFSIVSKMSETIECTIFFF